MASRWHIAAICIVLAVAVGAGRNAGEARPADVRTLAGPQAG